MEYVHCAEPAEPVGVVDDFAGFAVAAAAEQPPAGAGYSPAGFVRLQLPCTTTACPERPSESPEGRQVGPPVCSLCPNGNRTLRPASYWWILSRRPWSYSENCWPSCRRRAAE